MRSIIRILAAMLVFSSLACSSSQTPPPTVAGQSPPPTGSTSPPSPGPASGGDGLPVIAPPFLEQRSLLLALTDRRLYEPYTVTQALKPGDAQLKVETARYLGRVGDSRGRSVLTGLVFDSAPEVRRAAVFALGELGDEVGRAALIQAARDSDPETGRLAVEALAKMATPLADVYRELERLQGRQLWERLLPSLFLFDDPGKVAVAQAGLRLEDPYLHGRAAYALARDARPEAAVELRTLLRDPDPWVRGWAARGLGEVGEAADLARLRPLLDDAESGPVVQALRAGRRLVDEGDAAAVEEWRRPLVGLLSDPRRGVRLTALETSGSWLLDDALGAALVAKFEHGDDWEREEALSALAFGGHPRAWELTQRAAVAVRAQMRARAAGAAGLLKQAALLESLAADEVAWVRMAALEAQLAVLEGQARIDVIRVALTDPDPGVRTTALEWLTDNPVLPAPELFEGILLLGLERPVEVRLTGIRTLVARAEVEPAEQPVIIALLQDLVLAERYVIRRAAVEALVDLGEPRVVVGEVETHLGMAGYELVLQQTLLPRQVEIVTDEGTLVLRLECPQAPLTCLNFMQLAGQGFYDGLTWHRVVADFVVQGGDPRGDGWGGPGYAIRDEINRLRYERGVVGMAHSGADTAGSQFFITLSPQPHLDGRYTAFGRVIEGDQVLDRLVPGSRIVRVTVQ